ncbi:MAG: PstS family phosphate ABC transporter substrate-binding protein [Planctomycetia bacterium]|nr:PstS family phosphate ABC transporter substrate-binding protein [Planctomycetia bacterium]
MVLGRLLLAVGLSGLAVLLSSVVACSHNSRDDSVGTIKVTGSDTMVNLANAWREAFEAGHPDISLQVKGGGSGVGIAALCSGKIDIATASRPMKPTEIETAKAKTGKEPKEFVVGRDALAIYVHKQNPIESISLGELAEIYGENGKMSAWKDLDIDFPACSGGEIIPIGRQNSSGTYAYFKEAVLGVKRDYRQGLTSQSGSSDVVALVSKTPCAIGYSGMGYYKADLVKMVKVAKQKGEPGFAPSVESALDGSYPISRPLYLYTLGEPSGAIQEFIQWVRSEEGQKTVEEQGYVPLPKEPAAK